MDTAPSIQRCARSLLSQSSRRILTSTSTSTSTSTIPSLRLPLRPRNTAFAATRQFSSSSSRRQGSDAPSPSPSPAPSKPAAQASTPTPPQRPSIKDLLRDLRAREEPRSDQSVSERMDALMGTKRGGGGGRANFSDIMGRGTAAAGRGIDQNKMLDELSQELHETSSISLRLKPSLGRTIDGLNGDPSKGFRLLERKCSDNRIKQDARKQLFHVRRGQARKDIRRVRWRKLFLEGFIAECGRVRRMRKQGW
ncbi:hypothetical protein A1O1_03665 [Capronia coronata CBS 617.96]|uniref:Ribosomal protein S21 n=1 Tax=Capronia coronata CBS 617.96 TaxID=1182541 RepID=W9YCF2_9EURO|nr:uncharacterized protein A1O1_03665 [Capronia coronata CBS 617.96]EXJ90562.1 hypothetical protein A1O1_03665 [Capronia coronata CBS 617.96]